MCVYIYCACLSCVYLCAHIYRVYVHTLDLYNGRTYIRVHPREATLCVVLARGANGCYQDAAGVFFFLPFILHQRRRHFRARVVARRASVRQKMDIQHIIYPFLSFLRYYIYTRDAYIYIIHTDVHLRSLARKANRI